MPSKQIDIETIVDHALDETVSHILNEFEDPGDIEYAFQYLQTKVEELDPEDFEE